MVLASFDRRLHHCGGGGVSLSIAICQTTGPIIYPKMAFDSPNLGLVEYVVNLYLDAIDDVTGPVKVNCFFCHCWFRPAKQPYHIEIKPMKRY